MVQNERTSLSYSNCSDTWCSVEPNFNKQYCNIYLTRLKQETKHLIEQIERKWGKQYPICKLYRLTEENHAKCVVIGTLFKNQKLKPSILKQLAEGNQLIPQPILTHCTDKSDELFIEDELQRYLIVGGLKCDNLVTGITCALLGTNDDKGKFYAEDYIFAGYRTQIPRPILDESVSIILISGLNFVNNQKILINLQLLTHWLSGYSQELDLEEYQPSKIGRIIIAGNCIRNTPEEVKSSISLLSRLPDCTETYEGVKLFDKFLVTLGETIDTDVMPGQYDPSNNILPQKPMHHCLFPESSVYSSINHVSNPYRFCINGVEVLGTSGKPIQDVMRFSEITEPLDVLEKCLEWGHMAPTAPDTLGSFPFYESDPFVFEECPHVFFAGNQKKFGFRQCRGQDSQVVSLIAIPDFSTTLQACILNLKTLDCKPISFITL